MAAAASDLISIVSPSDWRAISAEDPASVQMVHWSERFLDVGYARGAQGPRDYDCWSYFRWVQLAQFGRAVPVMPTPSSLRRIAKAMEPWAKEFGWEKVEAPSTGDAVFMAQLAHPTHVGIWVGDIRTVSVLHCQIGGAALHSRAHLELAKWRLAAFYRYVGT